MHFRTLNPSRILFPLFSGVVVSLVLLGGLLSVSNVAPAQAQVSDTPTPVPSAEQVDVVKDRATILANIASQPKYSNLDSSLNRIVEETETGQFTAQAAAASAPLHQEASVAVTIHITEGYADAVVDFLEANGASPRNVGDDYIEAYIPVTLLAEASEQEGVISIRTITPAQPTQGTAVSQGASAHGATVWHDAGFKGENVKIGVIDVGFQGLSSQMGTELPASVEARCYTALGVFTSSLSDCDNLNSSDHGTAVSEAVFDIAPEASYYISNSSVPGDMKAAVEWMVAQGVDVIQLGLNFLWDGPGDGTSPFSVSTLKTVDTAVDGGITWVSAAGNNGEFTWFGSADRGAFDFHDFNGSDGDNSVYLAEGVTLVVQLRWDDTWGGADTNLDLILWDGLSIKAFSNSFQSGGSQDYPTEILSYTPTREGWYDLTISYKSTSLPAWIQLQTHNALELEHHTAHHSIGNPAESANSGLLAVGAAPASDTSTIEDFSSRGPTPDDRTKPDLVGADNVYSVAWVRSWRGTSQSSAHVAGLAVLVKQRFPDHTPQQVANYLKTHAEARSSVPNNTWGYGFAKLLASDAATQTPVVWEGRGSGDSLSPSFDLSEGVVVVGVSYEGTSSSIFGIEFLKTDGSDSHRVLYKFIPEGGDYYGAHAIDVYSSFAALSPDSYRIQINSGGNWHVDVSQPRRDTGVELPREVQGSGDGGSFPYSFRPGLVPILYEYSGPADGSASFFEIQLYKMDGSEKESIVFDYVTTSELPKSGLTSVRVHESSTGGITPGVYLLRVQSEGEWKIALGAESFTTPTPTPTPTDPSSLLARYDADDSGHINLTEVSAAIDDYFDGLLTLAEVSAVIDLYFG